MVPDATDSDSDSTSDFTQVIAGTLGDDDLQGGAGNTQFVMQMGELPETGTLGGDDTIDGGGGTNEIAFTNLDTIEMGWKVADGIITYATTGRISGSVTLENIDQIFAGDGVETNVRLLLDLPSQLGDEVGYIVAGSSGDDQLDVSNAQGFHFLLDPNPSDYTTAGTLIFGKGGNDTITGAAGGDIIFGGAGADTIYLGSGDDTVDGGAGGDHFHVAASDFGADDDIDGGTGIDILHLQGGSTVGDAAFTGVSNMEEISLDSAGAYDITLGTNAAQAFGDVTVDGSALGGFGLSLDAGGFGIGALSVQLNTSYGSNEIVGSAGSNVLYGGSGADVFELAAATFGADDTIVGGVGDFDVLSLTGGGTVADGAFANVGEVETLRLHGGLVAYDITLGSVATTALDGSPPVIDGTYLGGTALTLDVSDYGGSSLQIVLTDTTADHGITGSAGNDTITTGSGHTDIDISAGGVDTITAGQGGVSVDAGDALDGVDQIDGTDGAYDELRLAGDYSSGFALDNVSNINLIELGDGYSYDLTLGSATADLTDGLTVDGTALTGSHAALIFDGTGATAVELLGGASNDILTGGSADDILSGGFGSDLIDGGGGADVLSGGGGSDTFIYDNTGEGGDTISDFQAGAGGDAINAQGTFSFSGGLFAMGDLTSPLLGSFVQVLSDAFTGFDDASTVAGNITGTSIQQSSQMLLVTTDGTDSKVWYWNDSDADSDGAGDVDAGDLTDIATLEGVNAAELTSDNFVPPLG